MLAYPVIPALRRWRPEEQKFKGILSYTASLKEAGLCLEENEREVVLAGAGEVGVPPRGHRKDFRDISRFWHLLLGGESLGVGVIVVISLFAVLGLQGFMHARQGLDP